MVKIMIAIMLLVFPFAVHAGVRTLDYHYTTELTDASPTVTRIVECKNVVDVIAFVTIDKGATVVITPLPYKDDETVVGPASDTLTIADGGASDAALYSKIGSPKAKVVVTKTELGTSSGFTLDILGIE